MTLTEKKHPFGGAAQTETGKVMQSSSDCILRRPPADKRQLQTTQLLYSCSKSDSCSSSSRFPRRGCSLNAREQNLPFDNDIKGDGLPLCSRRSMFEVSCRQRSGRPSFLLLRSGDDDQLLSVQIFWNNCQCDMRIITSPFSPADA